MGLFGGGKGGSLGKWDKIGNKLDSIYFPDSSGDEAAAEAARKKALDEILGVGNTEFKEYDPALQRWLGDMEAARVESLDPTAVERLAKSSMEDVSTDPRLKEQQMASLAALQELANNGGMNAQDEANLARIQSQAATADRGRRDAILQNAAARGMGGGGQELLAQLSSSQAATDRQSQQGLDIAGMAQQRALDAMMRGGDMAGNIRGQDFSEAAQRAAAIDAVNKFNAQQKNSMSQFDAGNELSVRQSNAGYQQGANQFNTAGRQNIHSGNVGIQNDAQKYGNTMKQQQFDNNMSRAGARSNAYTGQAQHYQGKADNTQAQAAGAREATISAVANYATSGGAGAAEAMAKKPPAEQYNTPEEDAEYGDVQTSDRRAKKDIKQVKDGDLDSFLKSLSRNKFKYKDESDGEGEHVGPMAQDLAKSKVGKTALVEGKDGKLGYDKDKMQGIVLAALSRLSDKVDEVC